MMFQNYMITALRSLWRNKLYAAINIAGLSLAAVSCIIIFLIIKYDLDFDRFHLHYDRVYRVVRNVTLSTGKTYNTSTPYTFAQAFRNDFADISRVTSIHYEPEMNVKRGEEKFKLWHVIFADSVFFQVFDFKLISGNSAHDLARPGKVFLTQSAAQRLFPDGNYSTFKIGNGVEVEVAGIIEDPPSSSHMHFTMIVSMPTLTSSFTGGLPLDEWTLVMRGMSYIVLPENISTLSVEDRLKKFVRKYYKPEDAATVTYKLQPLSEIHFSNEYIHNPGPSSNVLKRDLVTMAVLGLFIVVSACINFTQLATALSIAKSKEIGVRKVLGAKRRQIAAYFFAETLILAVFAMLLSLGVAERTLPWLSSFLDKELILDVYATPALIVFIPAMIILTTALAGFYPALMSSRFNPVLVLKNRFSSLGRPGIFLRRGLVAFQFLIAQVLIIATLILAMQMNYLRTKPLGFDADAVINLRLPVNRPSILETFKTQLAEDPNVVDVSFSSGAPTSNNNFHTFYYLTERGHENRLDGIQIKPADNHYMNTFGLKLLAGRWFTEEDALTSNSPSDSAQRHVYIVSETAMKKLGFSDPGQLLGKHITTGVMNIEGEVVGVVEDFHVQSLHYEMRPVILMNFPLLYYEAGIKIKAGRVSESLQRIEKHWDSIFPDHTFEYEFLDDHLQSLYRSESRTFMLMKIFAVVSVFIGCLGLFGLISFMSHHRMKEVGIRKVLGASISSIVVLFSTEFVKLIMIAFVAAGPVAWYVANRWLQVFTYKVTIPWFVFGAGLMLTLILALATIGYHALKSARSNPTDSLRGE